MRRGRFAYHRGCRCCSKSCFKSRAIAPPPGEDSRRGRLKSDPREGQKVELGIKIEAGWCEAAFEGPSSQIYRWHRQVEDTERRGRPSGISMRSMLIYIVRRYAERSRAKVKRERACDTPATSKANRDTGQPSTPINEGEICVCGLGCTHAIHGHGRTTNAETEHAGFSPTRQTSVAPSTRCSVSRIKGELHPTIYPGTWYQITNNPLVRWISEEGGWI